MRNSIARMTINANLNECFKNLVGRQATAKEIWDSLDLAFEHSKNNQISCETNFINAKMYPNEDPLKFGMRHYNLYTTARGNGAYLDEQTLCAKLISCLSEKCKLLASNLLMDRIASQRFRMIMEITRANRDLFGKTNERNTHEQNHGRQRGNAMIANVSKPNANRQRLNKHNNTRKRPLDLTKVKCYEFNKFGHFKSKCPESAQSKIATVNVARKRNKLRKPLLPSARAIVATIANNISASLTREQNEEWLIDSGALNHMTHNRQALINYNQAVGRNYVRIANGSKMPIEGYGTVNLKATIDGRENDLVLYEVIYVPELNINLISLVIAAMKGMKAIVNQSGISVYDTDEVKVLEGINQDNVLVAKSDSIRKSYVASSQKRLNL